MVNNETLFYYTPTMSKKPAKREDEVPLDAMRLVLAKHAIQLDPLIHEIKNIPIDATLEYYFVPMQHMKLYKPFHRPGKPIKNLKLVNFDKPAISLSFYSKHKYSIQRDAPQAEVVLHLRNYRDELLNRSLVQPLSGLQQQQLQQADQILRTIRDQPDAYQACFSNYYHFYYYWYCTYRYFDDLASQKTTTSSEHLLKHTERPGHEVHQRLNIIFVDMEHIVKPVANDHKMIDRELETYPIQLRQGITTLYLRKNELNE